MSKLSENQCPYDGRVNLTYVVECANRYLRAHAAYEAADRAYCEAINAWNLAQIDADKRGLTFARRLAVSDQHAPVIEKASAKLYRARGFMDAAEARYEEAIAAGRAHGHY